MPRVWRFNSKHPGVLSSSDVITAGVIEIQVWMNGQGRYFASLRMSPESIHGDSEYVGGLADTRNGAVKKLLQLIEEKPLFEGRID